MDFATLDKFQTLAENTAYELHTVDVLARALYDIMEFESDNIRPTEYLTVNKVLNIHINSTRNSIGKLIENILETKKKITK